MPSTDPSLQDGFRWRKRHTALLILCCVLAWSVVAIVNCFRLGSETQALRQSVMRSVGGEWDKRFSVRVGSLIFGLARFVGGWFQMPPEARAGLATVRGGEVGIYHLREGRGAKCSPKVLIEADRAVKRLGWERVVGVTSEANLVAVYMPRKGLSPKRVACCVVVLSERDLVVVSARANPKPLMDIALRELESREVWREWHTKGRSAATPISVTAGG